MLFHKCYLCIFSHLTVTLVKHSYVTNDSFPGTFLCSYSISYYFLEFYHFICFCFSFDFFLGCWGLLVMTTFRSRLSGYLTESRDPPVQICSFTLWHFHLNIFCEFWMSHQSERKPQSFAFICFKVSVYAERKSAGNLPASTFQLYIRLFRNIQVSVTYSGY